MTSLSAFFTSSVWNLSAHHVPWCILVFVSSFAVCCSSAMSCVFYFLCLHVFFLNCVDRSKLSNYIGETLVPASLHLRWSYIKENNIKSNLRYCTYYLMLDLVKIYIHLHLNPIPTLSTQIYLFFTCIFSKCWLSGKTPRQNGCYTVASIPRHAV